MATKTKKADTKEDGHEGEAQPEETTPSFEFPTDFYGNTWGTATNRMLYWVQHQNGAFQYDGTMYEDGGWAVCSDDGEKQIVSTADFTEDFILVNAPPSLEPSYIAVEKAAEEAKKPQFGKDAPAE